MDLGGAALAILIGLAVGIPAGLGSAMLWFKESKKRLYVRVDKMEENLTKRDNDLQKDFDRRYDKVERQLIDSSLVTGQHAVQLGEMRANLSNIDTALKDLKIEGQGQNLKLDTLLQNLTFKGRS